MIDVLHFAKRKIYYLRQDELNCQLFEVIGSLKKVNRPDMN